MIIKNHFIHLFKYNDWATKEAIQSIQGLKNKNEKIPKLMSHIISAQKVWLNRVLSNKIITDPWEKIFEEDWTTRSTALTAEWINLLEGLHQDDLERKVEYKNTKGEKFFNSIKDIVAHVINHSTYHRAQIALLVRQEGGEPAKTDYIVYQREFQK